MLPKPYFQKDGVTLYHGDSLQILPQLEPESFDLVVTDPPYLVSYSGRFGSDWGVIHGDSDPSWVRPAFLELWRLLKPDSLCLTFFGWTHADTFLGTWKEIGFRPVSLLVLIKDRWGLGRFTRAQHEQVYLLAKGHPTKPESAISDVLHWEHPHPQLHPNQKPISAMAKLILTYCIREGCLLDPFCGSGTTLLAARSTGRRAVGIEIDEQYCELAALRLSQQILDFREGIALPEQLQLIEHS